MPVLGKLLANAALGIVALSLFSMDYQSWIETPTARRRFVRYAALGAVGSTQAIVGTGVAFLIWPRRTRAVRGKILVAAEDVPAVNAAPYVDMDGRFYLAHNADGLLAFSWRCTHMGCRTPWVGPVDSQHAYRCPCHGSTFDVNGRRTDGPARRPFDLMKLTANGDGSVTVSTEAVSTRTDYSSNQAVPYPA